MKRKKTRKTKSASKLTFDDAMSAAEFLVKREHYPDKPCKECKKTLQLLKKVKKQLDDSAIGNNLVWHAFNGVRALYIPPK
ncbi:MAG: hypothetical protein WC980_10575 [Candidatus Brocadiia bacterium]